MTRAQALTLSILTGLVGLVCIGLLILAFLPFGRIFPAALPTPLPPVPNPTPTFPKFLPTGSLFTPVLEPTATNTRVPTASPPPPKIPTPTIVFVVTFPVKPTKTPLPVPAVPVPTVTPLPATVTVPASRGYSVSFEADETEIEKGDCTTLHWRVEGAESVILNNESVEFSDKKKVCPKTETTYQLTVKRPGETELIIRKIEISINEEEDDDED